MELVVFALLIAFVGSGATDVSGSRRFLDSRRNGFKGNRRFRGKRRRSI